MSSREVWRDVPSVPDVQASSLGRLRIKAHRKPTPHGGTRTYGGTAVAGAWCSRHKRFVWCFRGKNFKVARLVCEAFHGFPPSPRAVCMHLDEDSRNNKPENLSWGTQKQNLNAPGFLAYCKSRLGDNSPTTKSRRARQQFLN
jgi:hypothetical protein